MTNEEVMQLMTDMGLHEGGMDDWVVDNAWVKFANAVAKHTLANIDPSSFMSWQEGYEAGKQTERKPLTDVLDFIEEFTGAERERHPMFSDGYDLALSHVKELVEAKLKEKNSA